MTVLRRSLLAAAVSIFSIQAAHAACTTAQCPDESVLATVRAQIATACNCAAVKKHKQYVKCAKQVIKAAVVAKTAPISRACGKAAFRCEARNTCGLKKAAVCCSMKNGAVRAKMTKKGSTRCAGSVCAGAMVVADACNTKAECVPPRTGVRSFRSVQKVFTASCALPTCHSTIARQGNLVLDSEDVSYESLVGRDAFHADAKGMLRVKAGDPVNSFLIRKLRGQGPGDPMPQVGDTLSEPVIRMISDWIARGARSTAEECAGVSGAPDQCDDSVVTGNFVWQPEPPLEPPSPGVGFQLYTPKKDVVSGTEWETCYAFRPNWQEFRDQIGLSPTEPLTFKQQIYRMHKGSHHLLLYAYFGDHPEQWKLGEYFPCLAASPLNEGDGPADSGTKIPIGGTQVAGTRYEVNYPEHVGIPLLTSPNIPGLNMVLIVNEHYTNPFQPPQPIYGEAWLNLIFNQPGEYQVLLDGIFAINYRDLFVEPYETKVISAIWSPRGLLTRAASNAAVFQLFGHMHKRGVDFRIDVVKDGKCDGSGQLCGRDSDCACKPYQEGCKTGQTCVLGPNHEDSTIYYTTHWDAAPIMNFEKPNYLLVNKDQGLRWTCTHTNGVQGDPTRPPKRCTAGCRACGWDGATRQCHITPTFELGSGAAPRTYNEGDPMPLQFGELADDDMCNMFGYFITQEDAATLQ